MLLLLDTLWHVRPTDARLVTEIAEELGVRSVTAQVLVSRGASSPGEARLMMSPAHIQLHSPWDLPDMESAVQRLLTAVKTEEKVTVYGDYDVDGQTATAVVLLGLRRLRVDVDYYIPGRLDEGYGLNAAAVTEIAERRGGLLITVDCGTTSADEVALAERLGMQCVVTDHHEIAGVPAPALALVNPKRSDSEYPFSHLAGVGVAYKLMNALAECLGKPQLVADLVDIVALGTIADVVPLCDENRVFAYQGLQKLNTGPTPGLAALAAVAKLVPGQIESHHVAFQLAPRLNAGGRMAEASVGVEMLLAPSLAAATAAAKTLDAANRERQRVEESVLAVAVRKAEQQGAAPVLVVDGEGWHPGVIGIVASRLVELYAKPAFVISFEGEMGTGSGRSLPGFNLAQALDASGALLERYGGHAMAAGLTVRSANLGELRSALSTAAYSQLGESGRVTPRLDIDACVSLDDLELELVQEMGQLGPFGYGNPTPVLICENVLPVDVQLVGRQREHLRLALAAGRSRLTAMGFRMGDQAADAHAPLDLAFSLAVNEWQGRRSLQLRLKAMRRRSVPRKTAVEVAATSETEDELAQAAADWPDRNGLVRAYQAMARQSSRDDGALDVERLSQETGLSRSGVETALRVFEELGLVSPRPHRFLPPRPGLKLDLRSSVSYNNCVKKRQAMGRST